MAKQSIKNRADLAVVAPGGAPFDWKSWFRYALSAGFNFFIERTCAKPDYTNYRRVAVSAVDDPPATTPPGASTWNLDGYWGLHGYLTFAGGTTPTADLELWAYDSANNAWFFVDAKGAVSEKVEFHFDGRVRNRTVFVRVSALTGSPTSVTINCTPE